MTWFKVDDMFWGHKKVADLESGPAFAEALALWTLAGSWCAQHLTDGHVPSAQLRKLVPFKTDRAAQELVRVGLWTDADGGFRFRDWSGYQPSKDSVLEKRAKTAEKVANHRRNRVGNRVTDEVTDSNVTGTVTGLVTLPPSRPDPDPCSSNTNTERVPGGSAGPRSERLRLGWRTRFVAENPKVTPPAETNPMSNGPWLEVARGIGDEQVDTLLDAYFADDFCRQGFYLRCLVSERIRLLTHGPKVNGEVKRPESTRTLSPLEADFLRAQQAAQRGIQNGADAQTQLDLDNAEEAARRSLAASRKKAS